MKKFALSLAAVAVVGFAAGPAFAQCNFNAVAKSKGLKSSMVRAFAECPSTQHPTENSTTQSGTSACSPVTPKDDGSGESVFNFSEKGGCSVSIKGGINKDCSTIEGDDGSDLGLPAGACFVLAVGAKCSGILKDDGVAGIDETSGIWTLNTLSRASLNDAVTGDVTVIDFPVGFSFETPNKGKMKLKSNSADALAGLLDPASAALPTCTQIEVVRISVVDGDGRLFARLGSGAADKGDGGPPA